MLHLAEYHPPIMAFAEIHQSFLNGQTSQADLQTTAKSFALFLEQLQQRLNWELPLLRGFSEAQGAVQLLIEPLQNLTLRVKHQPEDPAVLSQLQECLSSLYRVQCFFEQLPGFTDVSVVNELLILGAQEPEGEGDPVPVRQRMPALLDWISSQKASWEVFQQLYPQRQSLVDKAMTVVKALQGAAGGLHLFVEGEDPAALRPSLQLMVQALEAMAPLEETRYLEESQRANWSADLRLERAALLRKQSGKIPQSYQTPLRKWVAEKFRALTYLQGWNQLSGNGANKEADSSFAQANKEAGRSFALSPEELLQLHQDLARCSQQVEQWDCDHKELLESLEDWRIQFEEITQSLAENKVNA